MLSIYIFGQIQCSQDKDFIAESGVNHQKSINQSTIPLLRADSQHCDMANTSFISK
jgi:hypothetical protein